MIRLWLAVCLAVSVAWGAPEPVDPAQEPTPIEGVAPSGAPPADPAAIDDTARRIALGLRCPVCQGLSAADSTSPAAVNMQRRVRELVAQGYDQAQIEAFFVSKYGEWVLLAPTADGVNRIVWLGPFAMLVVGVGAVLFVVGRRTEAHAAPAPAPPAPDDPYAQALLAEIADDSPTAEDRA